MRDKDGIEVIDISRQARIIHVLSLALPLVLAYFFDAKSKEVIGLWGIVALISFWLASYFLERGKVVLRLGSFMDKDKRFYLYKNNKKLDSLRIRVEENASSKEIMKRFEEFILRNNLSQYKKIYLMGSNSIGDNETIKNILRNNKS